MISSAAIKSCERSRKGFIAIQLWGLPVCSAGVSPVNKFVSRAMQGQQKFGRGRVRFELLAKAQDVIVHGSGGRVILIAPDFV